MKSNNGQVNQTDNFDQAKVLLIDDNDDHWQLMREAIQRCLPRTTLVRVAWPEQALALLTEWQHQE